MSSTPSPAPAAAVAGSDVAAIDVAAIDVAGLRKEFGKVVAVHDVSFSLQPGQLVGLVGPNGAGKSTTFKMLTGQLVPTAGTARVMGVDVAADPAGARRHLGIVPEFPKLYEYLSAREMITFAARIRSDDPTADPAKDPALQARVDDALRIAGLGADADRLIHEYSQGMHRKTALACALVAHPPVLLLDEALNGLDPASAERVLDALHARCEAGACVLLSTHVLDTLGRVADRVVVIEAGRVSADVPASELGRVREMLKARSDGDAVAPSGGEP
ncbi:MAG: ABC transporter ATP-binding protein [Alphaproteobacteria bacterium]|nr:ABC transporter ATP-binding protein [Alphaproteobacteria bacterium]